MNQEFKNKLIEQGFDVFGTLERFMKKEDLYEKFLIKFLDDKNYEELKAAINASDYEGAFLCAHTLKGVTGNLGIKSVFEPCSSLLEKLRNKTSEGIEDDFALLSQKYNMAYQLILELKQQSTIM